jgi:hypothetical protein
VASATFTLAAASSWKTIVIIQLGMVTSICCLMLCIYFVPRLYQLKYDPNASKNGTLGPDDRDPESEKKRKLNQLLEKAGFTSNSSLLQKTSQIQVNVHAGGANTLSGGSLVTPNGSRLTATSAIGNLANTSTIANDVKEAWTLKQPP